jgi:hypothetical protein
MSGDNPSSFFVSVLALCLSNSSTVSIKPYYEAKNKNIS